jgi:hypothetical protein
MKLKRSLGTSRQARAGKKHHAETIAGARHERRREATGLGCFRRPHAEQDLSIFDELGVLHTYLGNDPA